MAYRGASIVASRVLDLDVSLIPRIWDRIALEVPRLGCISGRLEPGSRIPPRCCAVRAALRRDGATRKKATMLMAAAELAEAVSHMQFIIMNMLYSLLII